ncbi:MAG: hypothetical protein R3255_01455 [Candidatus Lokiarchaeia archaeon]|nr:hypothetical protein [Candidatus Lokiarchaeia archaeon]
MYCPKCNQKVLTRNNDFNIGLAIILLIFTGGIGLLIYVAVYLDKEHKPRCIHCNSICYEQKEEVLQKEKPYQLVSSSNPPQPSEDIKEPQKVEEKPIFCYNCGSELDRDTDAKFCALCGTSIRS